MRRLLCESLCSPRPPRAATAALACTLAGAVLALLPATAAAEDRPSATVLLLVARGQEAWLGTGEAFRAQLSDLPVTLRIEPVGNLPAALPEQLTLARAAGERNIARAVLWVDRAGPREILLLVTDPASPRLVVRRIEGAPDGPTGAATLEAAAVAARSQLRALLGGESASPDGSPSAAPHPATATRAFASLRAGYALDVWAGDALFHGAELRAVVRPLRWLSVALGTRVAPGVVLPGEVADLSVTRWPVALEVGWVARLAPRWELELALGPALEVVSTRPDPLPRGWEAAPSDVTVLYGATASAAVSLRLVGGVHLTLVVGADALFPDTTWSYRRTGEREEVAQPWPVRPRAALGLSFDIP